MPKAIVGRQPELAQIADFLGLVPGGARGLVIEGEPGIGKSTLWSSAVDDAAELAWRILATRPTAVEATYAFAGVGDLLEGIGESVFDRLPPPQRRALHVALLREDAGHEPADRRTVAVALLATLRLLAADGPVLLAVDDVQWLDASSSEALGFAIRRLRAEPVGVVLARRIDPITALPLGLDRWPGADRVARMRVGPLGPAALRELLRTGRDAAIPRPALRRVHASSGGNPLLAIELARALQAPTGPLDRWMDMPSSSDLTELLERRLAALPGPAQDAAAVAAALAHPGVGLVSALCGPDTHAWLDPAVDAKVFELQDGRILFTHPLLAAAAQSRTSPTRRREIHRTLAELVEDSEERARHLSLAADGPDERVALALEDAASRAYARGAPEAATELAARARALTPPDGPDDGRRRTLAEAEYATISGDAGRAVALLAPLLDSCPPGRPRAEALAELASALVRGALDWRGAPDVMRRALTEVGDDDRLRARIEFGLAGTLDLLGEDIPDAVAHARAAVDAAERLADPEILAEALGILAKTEQRRSGQMPTKLIERALELERGLPGDRWDLRPRDYFAGMLSWTDDLEGALAIWESERQVAADHGYQVALGWVLARMIVVEVLTGAWDHALALADEGDEIAVDAAQPANRAAILAGRALAEAHLGDEIAARGHAAEAIALAQPPGALPAVRTAEWALGRLELSLAHPSEAHAHLGPLVDDARAAGVGEPGDLRFVTDDIEALIGLGRFAEADALLGWFGPLAATAGRIAAAAATGRARGTLHTSRGQLDAAISILEESLARNEAVAQPFELARTTLALGTAQRHALRKAAARRSLDAALRGFERLGATLWAKRARQELASIGGHAAAGDQLTPTERRVADLVAQGRTNREVAALLFLTDRTIEGHLTRIYSKLGVRSRSELAHRSAIPDASSIRD